MGKQRKGALAHLGGFVAIPTRVVNSAAYIGLSFAAKALLVDVAARQWKAGNNGRLVVTMNTAKEWGWTSPTTLFKALHELIEAGFLYRTVQGCRPNKASWFALTWHSLDNIDGYDPEAKTNFVMWAFEPKLPIKNAGLNTVSVLARPPTATDSVLGRA